MDLGVSGLASNFDWRSLIDQLSEVERLPQTRLRTEQTQLQERNNAYGSLLTQLRVLQNRVDSLKSPELFEGRLASVADSSVATATAEASALSGSYKFAFQQLATVARHRGQTGAGAPLSATSDVSGLVVGTAGFASAVTAGTFRVNGAEVSLEETDALQQVFDKISAATQGTVTASYDPAADRIRLTSSNPITLGSATDTSNFLDVARLHNSGSGDVASAGELGGIRREATLGEANFAQTLSYGTSGTGQFRINGVAIDFSATDSVQGVIQRINESAAGVTASYDSREDRFVVENKATGDMGIALEDVRGNFLAASGLTGGTLERGRDLLYTVNDGIQMRNRSNTIGEASSGIAGLSVTALKEGASTSVSVSADSSAARKAITDFIDAYNKAQSLIASQTASSTDPSGKVSTNVLTSESDAEAIATTLRRMVYSEVSGLGNALNHLEELGIVSNSNDDTLRLEAPEKLDAALAMRPKEVRDLWSHAEHGVAARLAEYLEKTAGEEGTLTTKQDLLTRQSSGIDVQIGDLERIVQSNRARMMESFIAMEEAQAKINQQMQFLLQRFG
jgi:flagellar hook-associated protein 2